MRGKANGPCGLKGIGEQNDSRLAVEDKNPVGSLDLKPGIERVSDDDVRVEIALACQAAAQQRVALGRNRAIEILAVGERAAVFKTHGVGERAVEPVLAHIDIAQHRRSVYADLEGSHRWSELAVLRHEREDSLSTGLCPCAERDGYSMLAASCSDDLANIPRDQRAIGKCRNISL